MDDAVLREINERYFAAIVGGKARFFEDRQPLIGMDKQAFQLTLAPIKVQVPTAKGGFEVKPAARLWEEWNGRRFYPDGFILDPSGGHTDRAYNLWRGYGVEPVEGDVSLFREHLLLFDAHDYVWKWICWVIQNPADKPKVALVFRGQEGVGKGLVGQVLLKIFGPHGLHVTQQRHVTGNFNAHLLTCCLLFADEADFTDKRDHGVLKTLITEDRTPIEMKGVDVKEAESYVALLMSTNRNWVVPASVDARRFVVVDVDNRHKNDHAYWAQIWGWLENGGYGRILNAAMQEDVSDFSPMRDRVLTSALIDQQLHSLTGVEKLLFQILWEGSHPGVIPTRWFVEQAKDEDKDVPMTLYHRLKDSGWVKENSHRPVGWRPPRDLALARRELFLSVDWPDDRTEWTIVDESEWRDRIEMPF
tara:strand:- start:8734 stop:9987 length:1254 start_codon:yes stop_codon:yes gene_type:complete